jgi:hypothetical protein
MKQRLDRQVDLLRAVALGGIGRPPRPRSSAPGGRGRKH